MRVINCNSSQSAWETILEWFIFNEDDVLKNGIRHGNAMTAYDTIINIKEPYVDPNFDFNRFFNYKKHKWGSLVNNYIDLMKLQIVKQEILKKSESGYYNISFQFDNTHDSGKGCLLSCSFINRPKSDRPLIIVFIRASEIVKRLIFDLLLLQRIGEYIYDGKHFSLRIICPHMFASAETLAIYDSYKPLTELGNGNTNGLFHSAVIRKLNEFKSLKLEDIKYKIHRRAAIVIQDKCTGGRLLAKNLKFNSL